MKENSIEKKFEPFIEEGEKSTYSHVLCGKGKLKYLAFFIVGIVLVLSDCFFLGAYATFSFFSKIKWWQVAVSVIKLIIDVIFLGVWISFINEREIKTVNTFFYVTSHRYLICGEYEGETFFKSFNRNTAEITIKKSFSDKTKVVIKEGKKQVAFILKENNPSRILG